MMAVDSAPTPTGQFKKHLVTPPATPANQEDSSMDAIRPAVPAPPPAYNAISRVTGRKSLRPIVLLCTIGSFIWSLCIGIAYLKYLSRDGVSSKLKIAYIIQGVFFLFLALLEVVGIYAAYKQQIKAGKLYTILVIVGGLLVIVAETIRLALHFVFKKDIINACAVQNANDTIDFSSADDIKSWCTDSWSNAIWKDIAWVVFGAICSVFMYFLAKAYLHQLLDPNFGREQAASDRYRMNQMQTEHIPYGQDPPFVPPYGAPPNMAAGYAPPPVYDAPAYTPGEKGFTGSDSKGDSKGDMEAHDRDLAGQVEHSSGGNPFGRSDSEVTLQGREREGRV